ncbi:protein kinase domain-containing protein [Actinoplanes xinjiangensis]|uniref:protein kinase domain-containing protein n=1 Tax=Actinoplanes xinjiangensis TaxID=512350 RepID=UPI0023B2B655|nr:protein kinase [Actinoplanes xinjiangensis]
MIGCLGSGGMGRVYLARSRTAEHVAVKVLLPHLLSDERMRRRFASEIINLRQAQGLRVAGFRGADIDARRPWLAVEYVPGRTLRQHVDGRGPLAPRLVAALGALAAEGLITIQDAGLIHRDLKPANIMLGADGPRIIDLGIAVLSEGHEHLTQTGQTMGTVAYMSPEQATGESAPTPATDVYALGATLLFAATGRNPYPSGPAHAVAAWIADATRSPDLSGLPADLMPLISAMLSFDGRLRPTAKEVVAGFTVLATAGGHEFGDLRAELVRETSTGTPHTTAAPVTAPPTDSTDCYTGPTELVGAPPPPSVSPSGNHRPDRLIEGSMNTGAHLGVLVSAEKEILKLSRSDIGAVFEFQHKFRANPHAQGLRLKQLKGDDNLWSARVNADLRAVLLHVTAADYLLIDVKHRREVYDDLGRYAYRVNRVTGGLDVLDLEPVDNDILNRLLPPTAEPLFDAFDDEVLLSLGVTELLLPHIRTLTDEDRLLQLVEHAPQLTVDVLFALHDGKTVAQVRQQITEPVRIDDTVDPDDLATAVARPTTPVTTDDEALLAVLDESFIKWQVFLHPTQRALATKKTSGPTRVSGGPGTGKTVVALHRVAHLAASLPAGDDRPILLTTFNRNLANDLAARLRTLGGQALLDRVDVRNIDRLALHIAREGTPGEARQLIDDDRLVEHWRTFLGEVGHTRWSPQFLADEWNGVILNQMLGTRDEYRRARRLGRGRPLSREARDAVWALTEQFEAWLQKRRMWSLRQVAVQAARLAEQGTTGRYRHVIVDEAQDLSIAHWRLLRALVPAGPDDLFVAGDSHQRIYENRVALSTVGIGVRGRSHRLTLSYRTTRQILAASLELVSGESYDDLDDGHETLDGYRSLLAGGRPTFQAAESWQQELSKIVDTIRAWQNLPGGIAVAVPTRGLAADVVDHLATAGVDVVEIGSDGPGRTDGVHVGTMHRFKGLEYQRMILAGISDGLVPNQAVYAWRDEDPTRFRMERQRARSLLFVAATRARDELAVFWHGTPSPFITHRLLR